MIDVNKITSTLAKLPDAQLQQYAQMHKADPYIMALAMSESNRRKELRSAGQGAQGMQEQPKVVDQMVAEMAPQQLPEDQGIGQLNAGNMNFAGGGIIAFADGGDVERYQDRGLVRPELRSRYQQELAEMGMGTRMQFSPDVKAVVGQMQSEQENKYLQDEQNRMLQGGRFSAFPAFQEPAPAASVPNVATVPEPGYTRAGMKGDPRLNVPLTQPLQTESPPPAADKKRDAAPRPGAGLGAAAAAASVPEKSAAQRYADMQKEMGMGPEAGADLEWKRSQLAERKRAQTKGELEDFDKEVAARGEAFKGREERLAKREAGLGKMKDETTGLALLEAGLAIMSTPGGLATAIGKGAQTGLKTYGAGLEKLRSAQEKMDDARDQIEEFRRNEANMTAKERRQFKSAINRTETEIEKDSLDAAEKMYGYKREDAKAVFTATTQERLTDKEIAARKALSASDNAARERIAQLPQGNERIAMLLGGGDLAKGLAKFTEIQAGKFNPTTAYTDYISKRKEGDTVLTPQEFVTQIRSIQALMGGAPSVSNKPTGKALE
jgi:hypothetical protein